MRKEFGFFYKNLSHYLVDAKKQYKIVGWNCGHIPLELIFAAGMLPSKLLNKNGIYDFLILPYRINQVCEDCQLFRVPIGVGNDVPVMWWNGEYDQLIRSLEQISGVTITEDRLRLGIEKTNKMRRILARLFEFCENGVVEMSDVLQVCRAVQTAPVEELFNAVEKLTLLLEQKKPKANNCHKLLLLAGALEEYDLDVMKKYEKKQCSFTAQISYTGHGFITPEVLLEGNLLENLKARYSFTTLCSAEIPEELCRNTLGELLDKKTLDGVVLLKEGLFEPFDTYKKTVKTLIDEKGIPFADFSPRYIKDTAELDYIIADCVNSYCKNK